MINWKDINYYTISLFFACGKCAGMPIDKGLNAYLGVWKTFELRY